MDKPKRRKLCLACLAAVVFSGGAYRAASSGPGIFPPRPPADSSPQSRVTSLAVSGSESVGRFQSVPYRRTWGTLTGIVAANEAVHGLSALDRSSDGSYQYRAEFEIIAPAKAGQNSVVIIEAENRGSPVLLAALEDAAAAGPPSSVTYPSGLGNGFLFEHATSYARVQWQYGIAAGVPKDAEGVGEVILRDFGRLLAGRTKIEPKPAFDPGVYPTLILGGISQSAFFVNTFLAEGFNVDPRTGRAVFGGAIAVDGVGAWLALNQLAEENATDEYPYVPSNARPLTPSELLRRPQSDPFYIDIANYTDFYRLRASATDLAERPERMRRYDWPSPHARVSGVGAAKTRASKCNNGIPIDLNPISYTPYLRAVTLGLEHALGVPSAKTARDLPSTTLFQLGPAPREASYFNPLAGVTLQVPLTDQDDQPVGGVRFPEVVYPIGRPRPVSLPPVVTTSINETCGNLGGWQPFTAEELGQRYHDPSHYLSLYGASLDKLIASGYLLASDRSEMLSTAASRYQNR